MLIYPQQYVIDYPLHVGANLPASWLGRSIVSITLTYPQQYVIDDLLQIGAPSTPDSRLEHPLRERGRGMVYIRLCGSYFVDRTLGYMHISTLPLVGFLKSSSERHITFEIFLLSSILDFHPKFFTLSNFSYDIKPSG